MVPYIFPLICNNITKEYKNKTQVLLVVKSYPKPPVNGVKNGNVGG